MQVMITGANRGIGLALADLYRADGVGVIATERTVAAEHRLDVTKASDFADLANRLSGQPIDLLVCNAGVYLDRGQQIGNGYATELWAETFAANVTGVFLTVQAMLPNVRAANGKIAIISSQMASHERAPGGSYIYRSSKAAALNLGRNLATDLSAEGIAVGIYHPGWVRTDMGGASADVSVEDAAAGLKDRFTKLSMATTGCFETWDGRAHPY